MTNRARFLFALLSVAALGITACGGDDDDSASVGAKSNVDQAAVDAAAKAAGVSAECAAGLKAYAGIVGGASAAFTGGGAELERNVKAFQEFAKASPADIRADVKVVADAYGTFIQALVDSGWNPSSGAQPTPDQMQKISDAAKVVDAPGIKSAGERVSAYFDENCKAGSGG